MRNQILKVHDRVQNRGSHGIRKGTVIGVWPGDYYVVNPKGKDYLFASKGEYKVHFDDDPDPEGFHSLPSEKLELI